MAHRLSRASTIVFIEMPAFGHVNPSLPLARELTRRGERVLYYNDAEFRSVVESSGATFRAYPAAVVTSAVIAQATQTGDLLRVPRVILRATQTLAPFMLHQLTSERPDVVVLDSNALWGHIAVRSLGLPAVSLMTTILVGSAEFRRLRSREWLHTLARMRPSLLPIVRDRSRLLRSFGASVPRPAFPAVGGLNLALWPRELQAPNPRIDQSFRFVGPTLAPDPDTRSELDVELSDERPVVYMSLGTLHRATTGFYRACIEALSDLPVQLVLSTANRADALALGRVAANAIVRASVAQRAVLQHASIFITHGGMNSILESLASGVPMIVIPQQLEQLVLGARVAEWGAARVRREHLAGQELDARVLRREVELVLDAPSYRSAARAAQVRLRSSGGFRQAADDVQGFSPKAP